MNFSLNNLKFQNRVLNNMTSKAGETTLEKAYQLDEFLKTFITKKLLFKIWFSASV